MKARILFCFLLLGLCFGCQNKNAEKQPEQNDTTVETPKYPTTGSIERLSPAMDHLVPAEAQLEIIAEGYVWTEGPLWVEAENMLLFADIPPNSIFKWTEEEGASLYLKPSGYTGETERGGEPGANGLILNADGQLVMCQHGDRRMAQMDAPLNAPESKFITLADRYDGKRFNSPNDAVFDSKGNLYFTDPPYGLVGNMDDPAKEIPFQGVYRRNTDGSVELLTDELSRPNGIAFSPDEKYLYVANSDPENAIWMIYEVHEDGTLGIGEVFYDATAQVPSTKGLPDGLKIDDAGNLYATGPGGVWIFSAEGEHLGTLKTGQATSNCAFNSDKSVLYITADMYVMRLKLSF